MTSEKYQNKNLWFASGQTTPPTSNNLSDNLFNMNLGFLLMAYNIYSHYCSEFKFRIFSSEANILTHKGKIKSILPFIST